MSRGNAGASAPLLEQLGAALDTDSKREMAEQLVSAWRQASARSESISSLCDLVPATSRWRENEASGSLFARALVASARFTACLADLAARATACDAMRSLCLDLALRNNSSAARLQRLLLWERC